jgi:hypothetical protein
MLGLGAYRQWGESGSGQFPLLDGWRRADRFFQADLPHHKSFNQIDGLKILRSNVGLIYGQGKGFFDEGNQAERTQRIEDIPFQKRVIVCNAGNSLTASVLRDKLANWLFDGISIEAHVSAPNRQRDFMTITVHSQEETFVHVKTFAD